MALFAAFTNASSTRSQPRSSSVDFIQSGQISSALVANFSSPIPDFVDQLRLIREVEELAISFNPAGSAMQFVLQPWQLYFLILTGWINRQQQEVINHLRIENQIVKDQLGKRRILLNDDQRRRLAVSGKILGRKLLEEVGTLFTPDTILRWHRMLIAQK